MNVIYYLQSTFAVFLYLVVLMLLYDKMKLWRTLFRKSQIVTIFLIGAILSYILHFLYVSQGFLEGYGGFFSDPVTYMDVAKDFSNFGVSRETVLNQSAQSNVLGYSFWVYLNHFFFGFNALAISISNIFLLCITLIYLSLTVKDVFGFQIARTLINLFVFFTPLYAYSILPFKESFVLMFMVLSIYTAISITQISKNRMKKYVLLLFYTFILLISREWVAFITISICMFTIILCGEDNNKSKYFQIIRFGILLFLLTNYSKITPTFENLTQDYASGIRMKGDYTNTVLVYGFSGIFELIFAKTEMFFVLFKQMAGFHFLGTFYAYFPIASEFDRDLPSIVLLNFIHLGNVFWWFLLPFTFYGLYYVFTKKNYANALVFKIGLILFLFFYIFYTSDMRYSLPGKLFFLVFIAVGINKGKIIKKNYIFYFLFLIVITFYALPKWKYYEILLF